MKAFQQSVSRLTLMSALILVPIFSAIAQTGERWFNPRLDAENVPGTQQGAIGRADDALCTAESRSRVAQTVPRPRRCNIEADPFEYYQCGKDNEKRTAEARSALRDYFLGCMAGKGWVYGTPPPKAQAQQQAPGVQRTAPQTVERPIGSTGTAVFVTVAGHMLTNEHVVRGCSRLAGRMASGEVFPIELVDANSGSDLALLKAQVSSVPLFFRSGGVRLGERIVVYGFPLAGTLAASGNLTTGVISGVAGIGGDPSKYQISAPIQPGSSGGAVLDESGLVVGVVQSKLDAMKAGQATGDIPQNVNFAIKASIAQNFLEAQGIQYEQRPRGTAKKEMQIADEAVRSTALIACFK